MITQGEIKLTDVSLEDLERLIEKGREVQRLLQENPEIIEYMRHLKMKYVRQ